MDQNSGLVLKRERSHSLFSFDHLGKYSSIPSLLYSNITNKKHHST
uniref:Uncharacterized protein n=1 Tax=Manihot esculenta TaxID=3983 RepID=A0A2C9UI03_MANES